MIVSHESNSLDSITNFTPRKQNINPSFGWLLKNTSKLIQIIWRNELDTTRKYVQLENRTKPVHSQDISKAPRGLVPRSQTPFDPRAKEVTFFGGSSILRTVETVRSSLLLPCLVVITKLSKYQVLVETKPPCGAALLSITQLWNKGWCNL